jgi:hypothetical protein
MSERRCAMQLEMQERAQRQQQAQPPSTLRSPSGGPAASRRGLAGWQAELPSVDAVIQAIQGNNPADTAARQFTALGVLGEFISVITDRPPLDLAANLMVPGHSEFLEYSKAKNKLGAQRSGLAGTAREWPIDVARREVLATFMSQPSQAMYWRKMNENAAAAAAQERAQQQADAAARIQMAKLAEEEAQTGPMQDFLAPDLVAAKKADTDLSVFGIVLGQPLRLPFCPPGDKDTLAGMFGAGPVAETCKVRDGTNFFADLGKVMTTGQFGPEAPGLVDVSVRLPAARCPNWADCSLVVSTKNGYAMAISFLTRASAEKQDEVEQILSQKYHHKAVKDGYSECNVAYQGVRLGTSARALNRFWTLPGLFVGYIPYGSIQSCAFGAIRVQLDAYGRLVKSAKQREREAQPKM